MKPNEHRSEPSLRAVPGGRGHERQGHPSLDDLAAYHEGTIQGEERDRLRDHLVECRECRTRLLDFARFSSAAPPPGVSDLSDRDVEGAWQRMQPHLLGDGYEDPLGREEEVPAMVAQAAVSPGAGVRPMPQRRRSSGRRNLYALAAVLCVAVVGLVLTFSSTKLWRGEVEGIVANTAGENPLIWDLEPPPVAPHRPQRSVKVVRPERLSNEKENFLFLRLPVDAPRFDAYQLVITSGGETFDSLGVERKIWQGREGFTLTLKSGSPPPGKYELDVYELDNGRPGKLVAHLPIVVIE